MADPRKRLLQLFVVSALSLTLWAVPAPWLCSQCRNGTHPPHSITMGQPQLVEEPLQPPTGAATDGNPTASRSWAILTIDRSAIDPMTSLWLTERLTCETGGISEDLLAPGPGAGEPPGEFADVNRHNWNAGLSVLRRIGIGPPQLRSCALFRRAQVCYGHLGAAAFAWARVALCITAPTALLAAALSALHHSPLSPAR